MNRYSLLFFSLLLLGCSHARKDVHITSVAGKIQLDEYAFDYKTLQKGKAAETLSHAFTFVNAGQQPLVIQRVDASCDCISVEYPKQPIASGHEGTIVVTVDPNKMFNGYFIRRVDVYSNGSSSPATLTVKGIVAP